MKSAKIGKVYPSPLKKITMDQLSVLHINKLFTRIRKNELTHLTWT